MRKPRPVSIVRTAASLVVWLALVSTGIAEAPQGEGREAPPPGAPSAAGEGEGKAPTALEQVDGWFDKAKSPAPWLKMGADLRFRNDYSNTLRLNKEFPNHESNAEKYRPRWWATLSPVKDLDLNLRIMWEGKHFSGPDAQPDFDPGEVLVDNLNAKFSNVGGLPLVMTLGRQDIRLGDGWLVGDGTPLDKARTAFFDAARFTYEIKGIKTTADLIYIDQTYSGDRWINALRDQHLPLIEQDERGLIFWLSNRSLKDTEINGYYVYKDNERVLANGDDGFVHAFGGRMAGLLSEHWKYRAEGAHEFGERSGRNLRAFGFTGNLSYLLKDALANEVRMGYEFLSGDDPKTRTNEAFDLLWGRYTQWSELMGEAWKLETRVRDITNVHRFGPGWSCKPSEKLRLSADYYLLFADESTLVFSKDNKKHVIRDFSSEGRFRGEYLGLKAAYTFSKHLKGLVWTEFFFPGNYYSDFRNDVVTFLRGELYFTW